MCINSVAGFLKWLFTTGMKRAPWYGPVASSASTLVLAVRDCDFCFIMLMYYLRTLKRSDL